MDSYPRTANRCSSALVLFSTLSANTSTISPIDNLPGIVVQNTQNRASDVDLHPPPPISLALTTLEPELDLI
jgi:hypothetical protein